MIRQRIQQTAKAMFYRNGFKGVSVDEICQSIGIAKKTFYLSYQDKDGLVLEFVEEAFSGLDRNIDEHALSEEDAIARLRIFDDHVADFLKVFYPVLISDLRRYHDRTYKIFIDKRRTLITHLASIIELGKIQGSFRRNVDSRILAELRFNELEMIFSQRNELTVNEWYRNQQELFDHYLAGLVLLK